MDKNRFETQKEVVNLNPTVHNIQALFSVDDLKWLMAQAEKVERLEKENSFFQRIQSLLTITTDSMIEVIPRKELEERVDMREIKENEIDACYYAIATFITSLKEIGESQVDVKEMVNRIVDDLFD